MEGDVMSVAGVFAAASWICVSATRQLKMTGTFRNWSTTCGLPHLPGESQSIQKTVRSGSLWI